MKIYNFLLIRRLKKELNSGMMAVFMKETFLKINEMEKVFINGIMEKFVAFLCVLIHFV